MTARTRGDRLGRRTFLGSALFGSLLASTRVRASAGTLQTPAQPSGTPAYQAIDVVDAQLHIGRGKIDETMEAMNALGIRSILLDEFWGTYRGTHPTHIDPGHALPNGSWRAAWPTAAEAALLYPEQFSYLVRIDPRDPQLETVMRFVAASSGARAFRIQPVWSLPEAAEFARGSYESLLGLAEAIGLPVFVFAPGYVELLAPYARKFPKLQFVVDHCGMGFPNIPRGRAPDEARRTTSREYLAEVCKLAQYDNVALKWSHAQELLGASVYPYEDLRPLLRQCIDAFGARRIMWASDKSVIRDHTWSDLLNYVRDDPELSLQDKQLVLGGTARRLLKWRSA